MKQTISEAAQEYADHTHCHDISAHFFAGVKWMRNQYENTVFNYVREHELMSDSELDKMLYDINETIQ